MDYVDELNCMPYFDKFHHYDKLLEIISEIEELDNIPIECTEAKIEFITEQSIKLLDQYQNQPHLLDSYIKELFDKLLKYVYPKFNPKFSINKYHTAFKIMHLITKVRGYKFVTRYLPYQVEHLLLVTTLLENEKASDFKNWQSRYMLLLWLSLLVTLPFHFEKFDSGEEDTPMMKRILSLVKQYVVASDSTRSVASVLAAKFLTRPEISKLYLKDFIEWSMPTVHEIIKNSSNQLALKIGVPLALSYIFKSGKREDLLEYTYQVIKPVIECKILNEKQEYTAKILIKLMQWAALSLFKPKLAKWRYRRGKRTLFENLNDLNVTSEIEVEDEDDNDEIIVSDQVEQIIGTLLEALRHSSHTVRWSAAKGIGRITSRLPEDMAKDIVEHVSRLLDYLEADTAWHGGCLALAELARRGLILPIQLDIIVPRIIQASTYEVFKGSYALGDYVRDAACYVFWAFARAFEPSIISPYISKIASALLIVSVFDKEIHCRRAASAAFQENVGRQGSFPNGIDIVTTVDMISVSQINNAFINLSKFIAQFDDYKIPLMDHLITKKINYWDFEIRLLASEALSNLSINADRVYVKSIFDNLKEIWYKGDISSKHGSCIGLAYMMDVLMSNKIAQTEIDNFIEEINEVTQNEIKSPGIRGKLARHAICVLIRKISLCESYTSSKFSLIWCKILKRIIFFNDLKNQIEAISSFKHLFDKFLTNNLDICKSVFEEIISQAKSPQEYIRIGSLQIISSTPCFLLEKEFSLKVILLLSELLLHPEEEELAQVEWRSCIISSLTKYILFLPQNDLVSLKDYIWPLYKNILEKSIQDYTTSNKGDIGVVIRIASVHALKDLTLHFSHVMKDVITHYLITKVICELVVHCVSQNLKLRMAACQALKDISLSLTFSNELIYLSNVLGFESEDGNWCDDDECIKIFIKLLPIKAYCYHLWLGLLPSFGTHYGPPVKSFLNVINKILKDLKRSDEKNLREIINTALEIYQEKFHIERLCLPLIYLLEFLISSGLLNEMEANIEPLLESSFEKVKLSKESKKKLAFIGLLCTSLRFEGLNKKCLNWLTLYLCSTVPMIRSSASENLYTSLITFFSHDQKINEVLEIISECKWNSSNEDFFHATNEIRKIFGFTKILKKAKN